MELFFRNPQKYADVLNEMNVRHLSFDYGPMKRSRIDPIRFGEMHLGSDRPWKALVVMIEGVAEYTNESKRFGVPNAVYPAWQKSQGYADLINYCESPVSEDEKLIERLRAAGRRDIAPVPGQPHKVLIYDPPSGNSMADKNYLRELRAIQARFPFVEFIIHDCASYRIAFAGGFGGAVLDPHYFASLGNIILPMGRRTSVRDLDEDWNQWVRMLGYDDHDLKYYREERLKFNIDSARWAKRNFLQQIRFRLSTQADYDLDSPDDQIRVDELQGRWFIAGRFGAGNRPLPGDGIVCDACSLKKYCKVYRPGMVCAVAKSDGSRLVTHFGTRDTDQIIDGLTEITKIMGERVAEDLKREQDEGERFTETDKRLKDLFESGQKLAKIIDPKLNGAGTSINIGVLGTSGATVNVQRTPQELMADAVRVLEQQGFSRDEITPAMITGLLEGMKDRALVEQTAIAGGHRVIDHGA